MAPDPSPVAPAPGPARPVVGPAELRQRLTEVGERIAEAAGGPGARVRIVGVTKTFPVEVVAVAAEVGLTDLGENRAQELVAKQDEVAARYDVSTWPAAPIWHFIGGLQRNKVKLLAGRVALWHTVDREVLVDEIAKRDPGAAVLVQVNTTDEAQKSGCEPDATPGLVERARAAGLDVRGLMTMGPTGGGDPRPSFARLRLLAEADGLAELSMGMSGDYPLAVAEGATILRIGSALFGPRS